MNFIKSMIAFFKRLFNKENSIKMISAPSGNKDKVDFINSLKVDIVQNNNKNQVETLICFGDGLGIQNKINY